MRFIIVLLVLAPELVGQPSPAVAHDTETPSFQTSFDAERGAGEFKTHQGSILRAAKLRSLALLGTDAFRFSTEPALGGPGMVFQVAPKDEHFAVAAVEFYWGHPASKWTKTGYLRFSMPTKQYKRLTKAVDFALSKKIRRTDPSAGEIIVCTDGPGYVTERRHSMVDWFLSSETQQ